MINDRANGIRALKNKEGKGSVMTVDQLKKHMAGIKLGGNPMAGKFHADHYETSKGLIYFRSKWEAHYSQYLDFMIGRGSVKDWKYEPETFFFDGIKMGTNCYKPDFKVFLPGGGIEYHEVKGYMDAKSKTKLKRMKKYHPNVKVVLIGRKQLEGIKKSLTGLIKFY